MTVQGSYHYRQTVWLVVWTILLSHLGKKLFIKYLCLVAYKIWTVSFFFSPRGPNSRPGLSAFLCVQILCIFLKLWQFFHITIGKSIRHCFKIRNNHFSVTMESSVIFTCKYFKFGLNTISQSHFRNFSAYSIIKVIHTCSLPIVQFRCWSPLEFTNIFLFFIAYIKRFATLNKLEFSLSQMNCILTKKVGTAKKNSENYR